MIKILERLANVFGLPLVFLSNGLALSLFGLDKLNIVSLPTALIYLTTGIFLEGIAVIWIILIAINFKNLIKSNKSKVHQRVSKSTNLKWLTIIGIIIALPPIIFVWLDYPEYPFWSAKTVPSEKQCFVGDTYLTPTVNCDMSYNVKTASLRRILPLSLLFENETVSLKPTNDIKAFFNYGDRYLDVDCKNFVMQTGDIVCIISSKKSKSYTIDLTYKKKLSNECPSPEQISLDKQGSVDCSPDNECILNIKVESSPECGLRGYRVVGPEGWAAKDKIIFIDESGLPYDLVKAKGEEYSFDVSIDKGEWKVYTIHFPKPVVPK